MAEIDKLFQVMISQQASDLHLSSGSPPFLRIHGDMIKLEHPALSNENVQALVFEILSEKQKRQFIENWELDCSYSLPSIGRFRCNIFMQRRGLGAVFRIIPEKIKTVDQLGLPESLLRMIDVPRGLILVTGPTGSGKSTTLASLLHTINCTRQEHIITIEDPIEFVHENQMCLINQREVSSHTKSFANALRAALREDPNIILVGEMRDLETIHLAMTAAETGHVVFGTLHTNNASKTVDRIIDAFPEGQQAQIRVMLAESLRGVIAQTLFPRIDRPGRVAALEILVNNHAIGNLIREGKTFQIISAMQTGADYGMTTFENSLNQLVREGKVSRETSDTFLGKNKNQNSESRREIAPGPRAAAPVKQNPPATAIKPNPAPSATPPAPASARPATPPPPTAAGDLKITSTSDMPDVSSTNSTGLFKTLGFRKKSS